MDFDNCEDVYEATIDLIKNEEKDVFSYYIQNNFIRQYVTSKLNAIGLNTINSNDRKHIYVDLKNIK